MQVYHHYHQNLRHYFHTELSKLELTIWLHTFGRSLISIFIPIILYNIGFAVSSIILFYLIFNLFDVPLNFVARNSVLKIGARNTIIIGIIAEIAYFAILYFNDLTWGMLILLAFAWAIFDSFYWVAHWFVLNECIKVKKGVGKQIGLVKILRQIGGLMAPGIGALLLIFLNKNYLILVSILFLIFALIPLFFIEIDYMKPRKKQTFRQFFKNKEEKINFLSRGLFTLHGTNEFTLLPLFIFTTFTSIEMVGILPMVGAISSIVFIYYIGELTDRFNHRALILFGALSVAFTWIIRIMFPQIGVFYITTILIGFFSILISVPLDSQVIERGKKTSMLDTSTYRNAFYMGFNVFLYGILYITLEVFKISFAIAVFGMVTLSLVSGLMLIGRKH